MMRRVEKVSEPKYRKEIARGMLEYADDWQRLGMVPMASDHFNKMLAIAEEEAVSAIYIFGKRFAEEVKAGYWPNETKGFAETLQRIARRYITGEAFRKRITKVSDTTRARVIRMIDLGYQQGLGQDGIGKLIRDVAPALAKERANMIARTETHNAANYGSVQAAKETGLTLRKEWIAALDERTRFQHSALSGKIVAADEKFSAPAIRDDPAYLIAHPGDEDAPAFATINCRCALAWVTED
jgi:SPP1 gp7 family putative phage head morphogenesis protein